MYSIGNYDYDCTKKCRNIEHGNALIAALTKRSVSSEKLAAYIAKLCRNFAEILDEDGRSALHFAVSVGNRYEIAEFLIRNGANINIKDKESGHSPITRAILYGNLAEAVLLSKHGANLSPDNDFVNPLQYCCRVKKLIENENRCEIFVWGKNKNYNLGIGNVQSKEMPEYLETFRKAKIYIEQVSMNSYHSLFLSDDGDLYAAGHGKGGRLGSGDEMTLVTPTKVSVPLKDENEKIISISAGKNHSLVLTSHNRLYCSGSNTHSQLGIKSNPEMLLSFTEINYNFCDTKRTIATDYSSLVVGSTEIYAFGTNIGQFGFKKEIDKVVHPKKLPLINTEKHPLEIVECSNAALICYARPQVPENVSFLTVAYKYETKIYKKPLMEVITAISVSGGIIPEGHKNCQKQEKPLRFIVLTQFCNIFIWYETIEKFVRCSVSNSRFLAIDKILWCNEDVLISFLGNLYKGTLTHDLKFKSVSIAGEYQETYVKKELSSDQKAKIDLKRIPFIDKVVDFCSDPEGENFVALLENPRKYFSLPEFIEKPYDYTNLLETVNEYDNVHDLVLQIGGRKFPTHRIIVCARCEYLRKIIEQHKSEKIVKLDELTSLGLLPSIFELILRYLYTNLPIMKSEIEKLTRDYHQTLALLKKVLALMCLMDLITALTKNSEKCQTPFKPLQRTDYADLYDVTLKLDCDKEIRAHKCVLMSRLEYFNMMFNHSWSETDSVNLKSISIDYMLPILDFLYSNNINEIRSMNYTDNYLYNAITICDQFFVLDLKTIFELIASEKISIKNCGEIFEFSATYNCETLKNCCMQFISLNFSRILEYKSLEGTDPAVLQQVNKFYRQFFSLEAYRTITPYGNAVSDEDLERFVSDFSVDLYGSRTPDDDSTKHKLKNKTAKLSRSSLDKRNYEKEGILSIQGNQIEAEFRTRTISDSKKQELEKEINGLSAQFQSEAKLWTKVADKKDNKKKQNSVLAGLKANEVLKSETKNANNFVSLKPGTPSTPPSNKKSELSNKLERTPEPLKPLEESPAEPRNKLTFTLADITPLKVKSQKHRKRQSSTSEPLKATDEQPVTPQPETPANPWKTLPLAQVMQSPFDLSSPDSDKKRNSNPIPIPSTSRASATRSISFSATSPLSIPEHSSFQSIIEDERKQKQYYEKIKTKSLVLTQLEEKAIEELHDFYNVANTFDETITIERRQLLTPMNYATWYRQGE